VVENQQHWARYSYSRAAATSVCVPLAHWNKSELRVRRVRVRREPQVRERALAVEVTHELAHVALSDREDARPLRSHLAEVEPARSAVSGQALEHEDAPVVKLAVLLRLGTPMLPGAQEYSAAFHHPGQPAPTTGCWSVGVDVLNLGIGPVGPAEVAAFPVRVDRAHEVEVR